MSGLPDQKSATSRRRYMTVSSRKAMDAKVKMKETDQRFLLIGMSPSSLEKPQRRPPMTPSKMNLK